MTPAQRVRATVDKLNKATAQRGKLPTGGDQRMLSEAVNTGATAKNLARMTVKKSTPGAPEPLAEMIRKARKSYS
jgi:hypothetical protein